MNKLTHGEDHLCSECYEVNAGFHSVNSGKKVCNECGGMVLSLQEAADFIADLKSQLEYIKDE